MARKGCALLCALVLMALGCRVQADLSARPTVAPLTTEEIHIPVPQAEPVHLSLQFGAGRLSLRPGAENLVDGEARYNAEWFRPEVAVSEGEVLLRQEGERNGQWFSPGGESRNEWDLRLGAVPLDLTIEAGAYQAEYEFGGLCLTNLTIRDGASTVKGRFSRPNSSEMNVLLYETGASNVTLTGLANANVALFEFNGGAGNYLFEFGGELRRPISAHLAVGVSNVTLVIPPALTTQVTVEGLGNIRVPDGWAQNGKVYTQTGEGPGLTIVVDMAAGNLTILAAMP